VSGADHGPAGGGPLANDELQRAAFRGVRWVAASRVWSELLTLGSAVVLARLLTPAEFGHAAVALVLVTLSSALASGCFGTPLVQRQTLGDHHVPTAFTMCAGTGLAMTALLALGAPVAAPLFGDATSGLVALMAPVFLLSSLGIVAHALLQRALDFKRIATAEAVSIVARAAVAVGFAVAGAGAEAIIAGALAGAASFSVMLLIVAPRHRPGWDRQSARELLGFGVPTAAGDLLSQLNRNLDYIVLAARMPAAQVGFYWRAYQLGVEYERKVTSILMRMALPLYARTRSLADMRRIRVRLMRTTVTVIFCAQALCIALAPAVVPILFGDQWHDAVLPAQILAIAGMAAATNAGAGQLVVAAGRPGALLRLSGVFFFVYGTVIFVSAPLGLIAVCVAATATQVLRALALHWLILDRVVGIPLRDLRHELLPASTAAAALVAVALPLVHGLEAEGAQALFATIVAAVAGIAAYAAVLRLGFRSTWDDVMLLVRRVLRREERPARLAVPASAAEAK